MNAALLSNGLPMSAATTAAAILGQYCATRSLSETLTINTDDMKQTTSTRILFANPVRFHLPPNGLCSRRALSTNCNSSDGDQNGSKREPSRENRVYRRTREETKDRRCILGHVEDGDGIMTTGGQYQQSFKKENKLRGDRRLETDVAADIG